MNKITKNLLDQVRLHLSQQKDDGKTISAELIENGINAFIAMARALGNQSDSGETDVALVKKKLEAELNRGY